VRVVFSRNSANPVKIPLKFLLFSATSSVAEEKKNQGNDHYKAQNYKIALKCYTEAINLCPETAAYYGNRAGKYCFIVLDFIIRIPHFQLAS
jgi:hypothetical protein